MRHARLYQAKENSVEAVLRNLSGEDLSGEVLSGHSVQIRCLQESCRVGEISLGSEDACQVTQLPSNSEGKITRKHEYSYLVVVVTKCMVVA